MNRPETPPCADFEWLPTRVAAVLKALEHAEQYTGPNPLQLNNVENRLGLATLAFFRIAMANHNHGEQRQTCKVQPNDVRLAEMASDLQQAYATHIAVLRRVQSGETRRKGLRGDIPGSIAKAGDKIRKLDFLANHLRDQISQSEKQHIAAADMLSDLHPQSEAEQPCQAARAASEIGEEADDHEPKAGVEAEMPTPTTGGGADHEVVLGLAKYIKDAADKEAAMEARWEKEIRGLKGQVDVLQQEMVKLKAESTAAAEAETAKRETESQAVRGQLQVEKGGREKLEQELQSLKEELSALRKTSAPSVPDLTTEDGLDSLTRLILASSPFTETITRLLSLTVGHTLSLSVGCFAIVDPERVLQVAGACNIQHSLAALGVLHDLPAWAGERNRLFKGLVEEALDADTAVETDPDSKALDEAMLAMLKAGDIGDVVSGEAKAEEASAAFAEEREKIRSAWVDIVQAIKAQCQVALSDITQHRTAATETISAAGAEAVRVICEQSELELLSMEGKADKLDRAMLDFGRLYPVPGALSIAPTVEAETFPTPPPANNDLATILALLKQLIPAQQPAGFPSIPPVEAFSNAAHPSPRPSAPSATTDSPTAPGPTTTSALASVFGPTVTGPRR